MMTSPSSMERYWPIKQSSNNAMETAGKETKEQQLGFLRNNQLEGEGSRYFV